MSAAAAAFCNNQAAVDCRVRHQAKAARDFCCSIAACDVTDRNACCSWHVPARLPPHAAELQYQGRYVQSLLSSNAELQHEAEQLRLALDISRSSEQGLIRKALAGEKAADSLVSAQRLHSKSIALCFRGWAATACR